MKRFLLLFMAAMFTLMFFSGCSDDDSDDSTVASQKTAAYADNTPNGFQNTVQTVRIDDKVTLHAFIASKGDGGIRVRRRDDHLQPGEEGASDTHELEDGQPGTQQSGGRGQ